MDIGGHRRSEQFEDRGTGRGGAAQGAVGINLFFLLVRFLGWKKSLALAAVAGVVYFALPSGVRSALFGGATGQGTSGASAGGKACELSQSHGKACDFSRVVLASTEDVWMREFGQGRLPKYGAQVRGTYQLPTLVVFNRAVSTGCGNATSDIGPFYCPADNRLYIDPSFYGTMERRLKAPGDFAQAYVIAHEVGHHVQHLIGSSRLQVSGETKNEVSVRVELQADCFAGVWGHSAKGSLSITEGDLREALQAAHAIGDDALGHRDEDSFTHGSSQQRMTWFKRGFEKGDPRTCDTFAVKNHGDL
jgi:predicted metalloprotease